MFLEFTIYFFAFCFIFDYEIVFSSFTAFICFITFLQQLILNAKNKMPTSVLNFMYKILRVTSESLSPVL